jgi:ribosomal protein L11 methyltransferase
VEPVTASMDTELESVKRILLEVVEASHRRLTPTEVRRRLSHGHGIAKAAVVRAIQALTLENILVYTNQFGCTFLEPSFNRPVRIGPHLVLKPPNLEFLHFSQGDIVIDIAAGAAFGAGEHPTTRLALRALAHCVEERPDLREASAPMLDMGTGSGVLAIAALRLGINLAVGVDIDPCARGEAETNARINGLSDRMRVVESLEGVSSPSFCMVSANLRTPTLKSLKPFFAACTSGPLVFSGIRADEIVDIKGYYGKAGFECTWAETEKGWAGLVFFGIF